MYAAPHFVADSIWSVRRRPDHEMGWQLVTDRINNAGTGRGFGDHVDCAGRQ
jgi:hypothetical protein